MDPIQGQQNTAVNPNETEPGISDSAVAEVLEAFGPVVNDTNDRSVEASRAFVATFANLGPQQRRKALEEIDGQNETAGQIARDLTGSLDIRSKPPRPHVKEPGPIDPKNRPGNMDRAAARREALNAALRGSKVPAANSPTGADNGSGRRLTEAGLAVKQAPENTGREDATSNADPNQLNPDGVDDGDKQLIREVGAKTKDSGEAVSAEAIPVRFEEPPVVPEVKRSDATIFNPAEGAPAEVVAPGEKAVPAETAGAVETAGVGPEAKTKIAPAVSAKPAAAEPPPKVVSAEPSVQAAEPAPKKKGILERALAAVGIIDKTEEINDTGDAARLHDRTVQKRSNEIQNGGQ